MTEYILDLMHPAVLNTATLDEIVGKHVAKWGAPPTGISFPVTTNNGVTYPSQLAPIDRAFEASPSPLEQVASFAASKDLALWLVIDPDFSFVMSEAAHKKSFQGDSVASCCIVSPATRRVFGLLLDELLRTLRPVRSPAGIVVPIQDLWGMSADNGVVDLTCFCSNCRQALTAKSVDLSQFRGHPSPWNLLLKDNITGLAHTDQISPDMSPEAIVELSIEKGFYAADALAAAEKRATDEEERKQLVNEERTKLKRWALVLKQYVDAASEMTKDALSLYVAAVHQSGAKAVIIADSSPYDWSSRLFFSDLDCDDFADEVWVEPSNDYDSFTKSGFRRYMAMRGRYHLDALFEVVDTIHSPRAEALHGLSASRTQALFRRRASQAEHHLYTSLLDVEILGEAENCEGNVIPALDPDVIDALGKHLIGENWKDDSADEGQRLSAELSDLGDLLGRLTPDS